MVNTKTPGGGGGGGRGSHSVMATLVLLGNVICAYGEPSSRELGKFLF